MSQGKEFFQAGSPLPSSSLSLSFSHTFFLSTSLSLSLARAKNRRLQDYFDEDDDEFSLSSSDPPPVSSEVYDDPLDAFMAQNQQQIQIQTLISSSTPLPEIVSGLDSEEDEIDLVKVIFGSFHCLLFNMGLESKQ
jgi:hypothetical protein